MKAFDAIIIGAGPAGVTSAVYIGRAGMSVLLLDTGASSLLRAERVENFYGTKSISGAQLYKNGIEQAVLFGAEYLEAEALDISYDSEFTVLTAETSFRSRVVILATGSERNKPAIKGLDEFEGRGVSYCAVCDAFFFRGLDVCVIGNGSYAAHEAELLSDTARSVTVLTNGMAQSFTSAVGVINKKISAVDGGERLEKVIFEDGEELAAGGVFIAVGTASSSALARKLGAECENGKIKAGDGMKTSVPGLYAAGDCTGGIMQVSTACAEGTSAALSAIKYIRES